MCQNPCIELPLLNRRTLDNSDNRLAKIAMIDIRPERPADGVTVAEINDHAFSGSNESGLIAAIKRSGRPVISLLAWVDGVPVGHIFFSPIQIQLEHATIGALALAPMAVLPEFQRRGIGTRLVEAGLEACAEQGCQIVIVVGHPGFYQRFGFHPSSSMGLRSVYSSAGDAFMAIELSAGTLAGRTGFVEYPVEFAGV